MTDFVDPKETGRDVVLIMPTSDGRSIVLTLSPDQYRRYAKVIKGLDNIDTAIYKGVIATMVSFGNVVGFYISDKNGPELIDHLRSVGFDVSDAVDHIKLPPKRGSEDNA